MMSKARSTPDIRLLGKVACGLWLALTMYSAEGIAADFYIAPTGNDSNPGTLSSPWATINKANITLVAGDTVYLRSGTYPETIEPVNSGQSGNRITYKNYPNETVTVTGAYSGSPVVSIDSSISYITVNGLNIKQANPTGITFNIALYGSNSEIRNCRILNTVDPATQKLSGISEYGIYLAGGNNNLIEANDIEGLSKQGIKFQDGPRFNVIRNNTIKNTVGDGIRIDSGKGVLMGNLIENNRISGSMTGDGIQFDADYSLPAAEQTLDTSNRGTVIRNNWIFNNAENGIDLKGTSNIVIEGNYVFGNVGDDNGSILDVPDMNGGKGIHKGGFTSSKDVILRNNIIYGNDSGTVLLEHYLIYNNTIIYNNRSYMGPNTILNDRDRPPFTNISGGSSNSRAAIKNNIIGEANNAEVAFDNPSTNVDIDNNLYFNSGGVAFGMWTFPWTRLTFSEWLAALDTSTSVVGKDAHSQVVTDPMFVNAPLRPEGTPDQYDFRLEQGSPAIDAGTNLTNTVGSGNGNRIILKDAGYFFDGFGITSGDSIRIGANNLARITAVDYATNTITIDRSVSWTDNDPVNLDYSGSAPDIGALEYAPQANSAPSAPTGLQITISAP